MSPAFSITRAGRKHPYYHRQHTYRHGKPHAPPQPNFSKSSLWLLVNSSARRTTSPNEQEVLVPIKKPYSPPKSLATYKSGNLSIILHTHITCALPETAGRQLRFSLLKAPAPGESLTSWCHWGLWTERKIILSLSSQLERNMYII